MAQFGDNFLEKIFLASAEKDVMCRWDAVPPEKNAQSLQLPLKE